MAQQYKVNKYYIKKQYNKKRYQIKNNYIPLYILYTQSPSYLIKVVSMRE